MHINLAALTVPNASISLSLLLLSYTIQTDKHPNIGEQIRSNAILFYSHYGVQYIEHLPAANA